MRSRTQDPNPAPGVLDDHQHEQAGAAQGDGLEEVAREQRVSLRAQEAGPGRGSPVGCRVDPGLPENLPDGGGSDRDAQDEQLAIQIKAGSTTTGSGGTTPTPVPTDFGDAASGATTKVNNTTKATAGTIVTLHSDAFNVRAGWQYRPTPEERIVIRGARRLTVELGTTPADSITFSGTLYFREIG